MPGGPNNPMQHHAMYNPGVVNPDFQLGDIFTKQSGYMRKHSTPTKSTSPVCVEPAESSTSSPEHVASRTPPQRNSEIRRLDFSPRPSTSHSSDRQLPTMDKFKNYGQHLQIKETLDCNYDASSRSRAPNEAEEIGGPRPYTCNLNSEVVITHTGKEARYDNNVHALDGFQTKVSLTRNKEIPQVEILPSPTTHQRPDQTIYARIQYSKAELYPNDSQSSSSQVAADSTGYDDDSMHFQSIPEEPETSNRRQASPPTEHEHLPPHSTYNSFIPPTAPHYEPPSLEPKVRHIQSSYEMISAAQNSSPHFGSNEAEAKPSNNSVGANNRNLYAVIDKIIIGKEGLIILSDDSHEIRL